MTCTVQHDAEMQQYWHQLHCLSMHCMRGCKCSLKQSKGKGWLHRQTIWCQGAVFIVTVNSVKVTSLVTICQLPHQRFRSLPSATNSATATMMSLAVFIKLQQNSNTKLQTYCSSLRWTSYLWLPCWPLVTRWRGFRVTRMLQHSVHRLLLLFTVSIGNGSWRPILWRGDWTRLLLSLHDRISPFLAKCNVDHRRVWHPICSICWTTDSNIQTNLQ